MNSTTTVIDLIKELLNFAVDNLKARQFHIYRLETGNLIVDWSDGMAPSYADFIPTTENSAHRSPLYELNRYVNTFSIVVSHEEALVRLNIANGYIVAFEATKRKLGSRVELKNAHISDDQYAELYAFCDNLALCRLAANFEINDYTKNENKTINYNDDSEFLTKYIDNCNISPIKVFHGLSSTATGSHTFYSVALTTSLSTQVIKHIHKQIHGWSENINTNRLKRELDSIMPADCRARKLSTVIRTIDVNTHLDPDVALSSVLKSMKSDVFEYICNFYGFGHSLDYSLNIDKFERLYCPENKFMHAGIKACTTHQDAIKYYSPLYLYGGSQHKEIIAAALNSFQVEYRHTYPHHSLLKVTHENLGRLIDSPYEYDCIIIDNLDKLLSEINDEEEYNLSDALLLRKYSCKMTFVIAHNPPYELDNVCEPLKASLNKGLVINAV